MSEQGYLSWGGGCPMPSWRAAATGRLGLGSSLTSSLAAVWQLSRLLDDCLID